MKPAPARQHPNMEKGGWAQHPNPRLFKIILFQILFLSFAFIFYSSGCPTFSVRLYNETLLPS